MIELEIDGKKVSSNPGATILEVSLKEGRYIPHFCYHKKLSIAANCRMCLVEVEKSAKPLPACATPITEGMKVKTHSKLASNAQKGVMELLLINHPLDCPVCDQGGECQLQDLAMGYGKSSSRFTEEKRAVSNKDLGPLIKTEMTRCIHCSRCVRFTDEIGGLQELGLANRNNHVEIVPFAGKTVNSEISGNIIDICPVGALLSKPFRHQARTWELSRRKSIAPHDSLGSNIMVQVDKYHKVVRVLPLENEAINECWLSDRDRFSYEALNHEERALLPQIKQDGVWLDVDWETALSYVAKNLIIIKNQHTADNIGVLAGANSTTEELYLLQKLMRSFGVNNLDYRTNQVDFSLDNKQKGAQFLGGSIIDFVASKAILVIGSILREEQPLLAQRIRQAVKQGCELHSLSVMAEDLLCEVKNQVTLDPRELVAFLAQVVKATMGALVSNIDLDQIEISEKAQAIADSLSQHKGYIVLGEIAKSVPEYSSLIILANQLALNIKGNYGILAGRANEVGAQMVGFIPYLAPFNHKAADCGLNAKQMLEDPRKAYILFNTELELDAYNSKLAVSALSKADTVIVMTPFVSQEMKEYADVILPITPFSETAGSFVNMEGVWQKFNGVTKPLAEAKPGWKVLRVLANNLGLNDFEQISIEDIRSELTQLNDPANILNNSLDNQSLKIEIPKIKGLIRCGIQGIYNIDSLTRRAQALQETVWAKLPTLSISDKLAKKMKIKPDAEVNIRQGDISRVFKVAICETLPETTVILCLNKETVGFAGRFDSIEIV